MSNTVYTVCIDQSKGNPESALCEKFSKNGFFLLNHHDLQLIKVKYVKVDKSGSFYTAAKIVKYLYKELILTEF